MMSNASPMLAQLVRAVRYHADPVLAQLGPESSDLMPLLQALTVLEQYANATPDLGPALPPDHTSLEPAVAGVPLPSDAALRQVVAEHAQFQQALRDAPIGICIFEGPEYRFTFTNPVYDQLVGRTQLVGKPLRTIFPELDGQGIYALLDGVLATGIPFVTPETLVQLDRDGDGVAEDIYYAFTYAPLRAVTGQVIGVMDYVTDVTDRHSLEQERARSVQLTQAALAATEAERQRLLTILHSAPAAISVHTGPEHRYTFTNAMYDQIIRRDVRGMSLRDAFPEIAGQGLYELYDQVYTTGVPFVGREIPVTLQHADGTRESLVVNLSYIPMRAADGTITGIFEHSLDVTELVVARQAAEAAVVARDEFFAIAAHELRTPLTTMLGYLELVQRRLRRAGTLDSRTDEMLTMLAGQGQRLSRLITTLTDVSRMHRGHLNLARAPLDLAALVQHVVDEVRVTAPDRDIAVTRSPNACRVLGDRLRLEQVMINLVQNALKYSPDGGAVAVTVGCDPEQVWVQVQDQGMGIPAAAQPHLFERFYRVPHGTDAALPGMGLGLAVAHELVTLHGGTIAVESTEGAGSTFTVTLPRTEIADGDREDG